MNTLYLDCFAGISGDIFVGALIDLGVETKKIERELSKLPLTNYRLQIVTTSKGGIRATSFKVYLENQEGLQISDSDFREVEVQDSDQKPWQISETHGRGLNEILAMIARSDLSAFVKETSAAIFSSLGAAEARIHQVELDKVHFHEVGGVDAVVDIVSAAICLEELGIPEVVSSPLNLGNGFVNSSHGILPVPAPATAELLTGIPVFTSQLKGELVTPTGAAIIKTIAREFGALPMMRIQAVGYGAGTRDRDFPNVLRAFLGKKDHLELDLNARLLRTPHPEQHDVPTEPGGYHNYPAVILETNIDDSNPQLFEYLMERLLAAGALDVMLIPTQMKKSRPGALLHVVANPDDLDQFLQIIFQETTTIGVRSYSVTKHMLQRSFVEVMTDFGPVRIKVSWLGEKAVSASPEYEDCRSMAQRTGRPLKDIMKLALETYNRANRQG